MKTFSISDRLKHNLEFENEKQTEHYDLKDGITTCITKQPMSSGQGCLFILFPYQGVLQHSLTDQKGNLGEQLLSP